MPAIGDYSTSEQNTGFTWIDGNAIYKKTIHFGALPNGAEKSVASGITDFDVLVDAVGIAFRADKTSIILPSAATTGNNNVEMYINKNLQIVINCGTNRSAFDCYVTLYYTKTS